MDDVLECAVSLAREELKLSDDAEVARLMAQITAVFTEASRPPCPRCRGRGPA